MCKSLGHRLADISIQNVYTYSLQVIDIRTWHLRPLSDGATSDNEALCVPIIERNERRVAGTERADRRPSHAWW
ncbi:unnamed protein product [Danaus chrysippus]|uniref:(African queen) hypothetical protein n=1 Tax=Danaus chrysippus TaxID=151541 RepID=A0A8J2VZ66_9NEOP|nr:unnamed protein product [Danaus chrysippus]